MPILSAVTKLLSVALVLQTIEWLQGARTLYSVWSWEILRVDYPGWLQRPLGWFLDVPGFSALLWARLLLAVGLFWLPNPWVLAALFVSQVMIFLRWRGPFNGGSDSMSFVLLSTLALMTALGSSKALEGGLWYIALQGCLSYAVAGVVKLAKRSWRSGEALAEFLRSSTYEVPSFLGRVTSRPGLARVAAWILMVFECSFPLVLLSPEICRIYLIFGLIFHGLNAYAFGLNRFFWIWAATYPAIYACSGHWRLGF